MTRRWFAPLVLVGLAVLAGLAAAVAAPLRLPPHGDRSVHDLVGVLSADTVETLETRHRELYDKTGVGLVMVLVRALEDETLSDFAVRVGSEWGVGRKGQDRGIVVALTTEEPHIFVATGYGVEGFLPDGRVGGILDRDVVPPLHARDFDGAMRNLDRALVAACAEEYGVRIGDVGPEMAPPKAGPPAAIPIVLIILLVVVALIVRSLFVTGLRRGRRGMWYGGGFPGGFGGGGFGGGFGGGGFGGGGGGFGGFGGGGFGGGGAGR